MVKRKVPKTQKAPDVISLLSSSDSSASSTPTSGNEYVKTPRSEKTNSVERLDSLPSISMAAIEELNKNIIVDASRFLITELGAFAARDFKKKELIAYYVGARVSDENSTERDNDLYVLKLKAYNVDIHVSPSAPYDKPELNAFNKSPLCLAAFLNDARGTDLTYNAMFSGGVPRRVVLDDDDDKVERFAIELLCTYDIRKGDEILISYGDEYWQDKKTEVTENLLANKEGPFRFFEYSVIDTSLAETSIDNLLDSNKVATIAPEKEQDLLRKDIRYSLYSIENSAHSFRSALNIARLNADEVFMILLQIQSNSIFKESANNVCRESLLELIQNYSVFDVNTNAPTLDSLLSFFFPEKKTAKKISKIGRVDANGMSVGDWISDQNSVFGIFKEFKLTATGNQCLSNAIDIIEEQTRKYTLAHSSGKNLSILSMRCKALLLRYLEFLIEKQKSQALALNQGLRRSTRKMPTKSDKQS